MSSARVSTFAPLVQSISNAANRQTHMHTSLSSVISYSFLFFLSLQLCLSSALRHPLKHTYISPLDVSPLGEWGAMIKSVWTLIRFGLMLSRLYGSSSLYAASFHHCYIWCVDVAPWGTALSQMSALFLFKGRTAFLRHSSGTVIHPERRVPAPAF